MKSPYLNPCRFAATLILPVLFVLSACQAHWPEEAQPVSRRPVLYPDYGETVIAPNIAPLNFEIKESGVRFLARIAGEKGGSVEVSSRDGRIVLPARAWKQLIAQNRGAAVSVTITVQDERRRLPQVRCRADRRRAGRCGPLRRVPAHSAHGPLYGAAWESINGTWKDSQNGR